ncbi:HlyD family secretion protein [Kribbella amoyensis]|uniref:HlyD family secretion protein n=1 Tax=Kribbella amoyensis TaxID=996641 RepID=A0A561BL94_9ACTN|nr:HlyD family efflux transporter periplasmic adaptor subunit [Kribbella amoyensis]TWD79625.1 HlyD family secretion protein [Kribbella amoyensis]
MSRGRTALTAVAVLAVGGALTAVLLTRTDSSQAADAGGPTLPPNTAKVTQQTLKDTETADGELGYGTTSTAVSRSAGTVTAVPESGQLFHRGQTVFSVNDKPTVLLYGALPAYRRLAVGSEGQDVLQLEQNLAASGYTGFTVDDEYTANTAEAVEQWQEDKGFEETGSVELGQVLFAAGPVRVDNLAAQEGAPIGPGQNVLGYTATTKAVTVELEAADQRLAKKGAKVTVTLPDDKTAEGVVDKVSTVVVPATGQDQDPTTKIEVIVAISNQKALAGYTSASVDVTFTASERKNVLTVPVAALLALSEGGFGVEVTDGTSSRYVPVKTGLFANGRVEVSGSGIAAGVSVGVPK